MIFPDISFYQDDNETLQGIDFAKMATMTDKVIIRAGQNTWIDPDFAHNWQAAKEAGLKRGSYWYYDSRSEPEAQARLWAKALSDDPGELPLHVDIEEKYGGAWAGWRKWMAFVKYVQRHIPNKKIVVYTAPGYWNEFGPSKYYNPIGNAFFAQFPLWIAHYGVDKPLMPKNTWTKAMIWQYTMTGDGAAYGTESKGIDLNKFLGDADDLAWYSGDIVIPAPAPAPVPAPNLEITGKLLEGMNLRTSPVVSDSNHIGYLFKHTLVSGGRVNDGLNIWLEIDGGSFGNLYVAEYYNGVRYIKTDTNPTQPVIVSEWITIPDDGKTYYQLLHDWSSPNWGSPRQDAFNESVDKHLPMPETVILCKELWQKVPDDFVQLQKEFAKLDSPGRTAEQHEKAFSSLVAPHRAFTDLGHWRSDNDYDWKVSLSTGGNVVRGYRNGTNLHIEAVDMNLLAPNADELYPKFWLRHRATQIHPRIEYLYDGEVQIGERRNKFPDGTFRVTHFPQGENCTSFPLMYPGGEIVIKRNLARELKAGDKVKVVNLRS